jgi:hypothetical protein
MRYLLFVLALLGGISSAIAPASAGRNWGGCGGDNDYGGCCYQGGNDDSQGNEDCP